LVLVQVYLHKPEQAADAAALAQEFDSGTSRRGFRGLEIPLPAGTLVDIELDMPDCDVEQSVQRLVWRARAECVQFDVRLPSPSASPTVRGSALVRRDGVPIGRVGFRIAIGDDEPGSAEPQGEDPVRFKLAFISYASTDRAEVLARVQGLTAAGVEYFQDLLTLQPGERYEDEIYRKIDECDLFLLFWSPAAKNSEWVRREAQRALSRRAGHTLNLPEIRPVVLGPPPPEAPWPELGHLHFNDLVNYVIAIEQRSN
jgi:hypothetical protein